MTPSSWLYDFLKTYEKFRPTAYLPTKNDVWTLGWGHTHGVREGDTCTMPTAQARLEQDVAGFATIVCSTVKVPLAQEQFDALVSLCFNIGGSAFLGSTLVKTLNTGSYAGAAAEFGRWNKQAGRVLDGLTVRRAAERDHFLSPHAPVAVA